MISGVIEEWISSMSSVFIGRDGVWRGYQKYVYFLQIAKV